MWSDDDGQRNETLDAAIIYTFVACVNVTLEQYAHVTLTYEIGVSNPDLPPSSVTYRGVRYSDWRLPRPLADSNLPAAPDSRSNNSVGDSAWFLPVIVVFPNLYIRSAGT
jgi:hypothetical protein